jgi:hydrogenase large subunit
MRYFQDKLMANLKAGDLPPPTSTSGNLPPGQGSQGRGLHRSAARRPGPLDQDQGRPSIDNYQCVVPTTWNGSPRDTKGQIGAFEASLMNTPMAKADQPLEILRTLHSFDPCLACSTHVMAPDGQELTKVGSAAP